MATPTIPATPGTDTAAVAVFGTHDLADAAVKELASARFDITKISVVGRGFHTEEKVGGFYTKGDRVKFWGMNGAFWGGLWGLLFGGLFLTVPVIGPVVILGHLAVIVASGLETAIVVGGLSAIGAALYGIGIPKDAALRYEKAIKEDRFLVIVHGSTSDVDRAREILENGNALELDVHHDLNMNAMPVTAGLN
jgi:hypothetical protein